MNDKFGKNKTSKDKAVKQRTVKSKVGKYRAVMEYGVGETRAAIYSGKTLIELHVRRWSNQNKPRTGDIFSGLITRIEPSIGAAFVDLGHGPDGFLKFSNAPGAPRLSEGKYIEVFITREAEPGKGPVLKFERLSKTDGADAKKKGPVKSQTFEQYLTQRFGNVTFDKAAVNALEQVLEEELAIPGGGDLAIERTRALTAIDIDKGAANSGFTVSLAACALIASQIRLRGLGGLFVIDFPNLRQVKQRENVYNALVEAFEGDPETIKIAPLSRFGTMEMTRAKTRLSLDETLMNKRGEPTVETSALWALRRLEREGRASAGAQLTLSVPADVLAWLEADTIGWKAAMSERLGARFVLKLADKVSVEADR